MWQSQGFDGKALHLDASFEDGTQSGVSFQRAKFQEDFQRARCQSTLSPLSPAIVPNLYN